LRALAQARGLGVLIPTISMTTPGRSPQKRIPKMSWLKNHTASARVVALVALSGLGLSACATNGYVDEKIAGVNSRIDQLDARVQSAAQRADAANSAAASANSAAAAAATEARTANQRLDQLGGRVDQLEKPPAAPPTGRTPRG